MRSAARRHTYGSPPLCWYRCRLQSTSCRHRPLDHLVLDNYYRLFNVKNLKLTRFEEIFQGAAETDAIDIRKILELFRLKDSLRWQKMRCRKWQSLLRQTRS